MWSQVSGGEVIRVIPSPIALEINSIQYPRNIFTVWSKSELKDIGIYPYSETIVDKRYYWSGSLTYNVGVDEVTGTYETTERDIADLKKNMIRQTKDMAASLLSRDDWMVLREAEGGTAMPADIKTYRTAVRTESNEKVTAINALSNLDAIKLYEATPYTETRKTETYDDDNNVTYGAPNIESEKHLNLVTHYFAEDPLAEVDPGYVSLVKK